MSPGCSADVPVGTLTMRFRDRSTPHRLRLAIPIVQWRGTATPAFGGSVETVGSKISIVGLGGASPMRRVPGPWLATVVGLRSWGLLGATRSNRCLAIGPPTNGGQHPPVAYHLGHIGRCLPIHLRRGTLCVHPMGRGSAMSSQPTPSPGCSSSRPHVRSASRMEMSLAESRARSRSRSPLWSAPTEGGDG